MKLNKNDKAFIELNAKAKAQSQPLKTYLLDEKNKEDVCKIFYENLPKLLKFSMNYEKFKVFYGKNKEAFVKNIPD